MRGMGVRFDTQRLRRAIDDKPYTVAGLAKDAEVTTGTIWKALRGSSLSPDTARAICSKLGVKWTELRKKETE